MATRPRTAWVIGKRDARDLLTALGTYLALALAWGAGTLLTRNRVQFASDNSIAVLSEPLLPGVFLSIVVVSLYLAFTALLSVARERDLGTLQVLFYGPVEPLSYVAAKYGAQAVLAAILLTVTGVWAATYAGIMNLAFTAGVAAALLLGLGVSSNIVALGILLSTLARNPRTALLAFLSIAGLLIALQAAYTAVNALGIGATNIAADPRLFLRTVLSILQGLARWVSPYAYLSEGLDALQAGRVAQYLGFLALSAVQTVVLLAASVAALYRSGVAS